MYQLRSSCAGNVATRRPPSGTPPPGGRNDAAGRNRHDHRLLERAVRHRCQPRARHCAPVVPDDHVAARRPGRVEHPQRIVHQRTDVVAAVRGDRRRRIAPHERCDHPPARVDQHRRNLAPPVRRVGKTVQAQRDRRIFGPPRQDAQLHGRRRDVDRVGLEHQTGSNSEISQRSSTFSIVTRTLDAVSDGGSWPTTTVWLTKTRTTACFGSADTDAASPEPTPRRRSASAWLPESPRR